MKIYRKTPLSRDKIYHGKAVLLLKRRVCIKSGSKEAYSAFLSASLLETFETFLIWRIATTA